MAYRDEQVHLLDERVLGVEDLLGTAAAEGLLALHGTVDLASNAAAHQGLRADDAIVDALLCHCSTRAPPKPRQMRCTALLEEARAGDQPIG